VAITQPPVVAPPDRRLLLRQELHKLGPQTHYWCGRGPLVSPRAADGCIAPMIRKPLGATTTLPVALLLP
jgi:hypothetical protein